MRPGRNRGGGIVKPTLKVTKTEKEIKREQRQAKLAALAEKKAKNPLKLEDVDAKLDMVLEMLEELLTR